MLLTNTAGLKQHIRESDTTKQKLYYGFILVLRAALVVVFCILFVSILTALFGDESSPMAVVLVVMVLIMRSINFGYRIVDTLVNFAIVMLVLLFAPALIVIMPSWSHIFLHLISMTLLIMATCQIPQYGYCGFISFAYIYLIGNSVNVAAVEGAVLTNRIWTAIAGYVICSAILIHRHHAHNRDVKFTDLLKRFSFKNELSLWQVRQIVGISLVLVFGVVFHVRRFMWMGFACSTVLAQYPYSEDNRRHSLDRMEGAVIGCLAYYLLFLIIPESYISIVGILGGVVLGLCVTYRWKTIVICFGALSTASEFYAVGEASLLRVTDNILGVVFAMIFADLFYIFVMKPLLGKGKKAEEKEIKAA